MEMILDIYKKVSKDASKEQIIDNMIASLAQKVKKDFSTSLKNGLAKGERGATNYKRNFP